MIKNNKYYLIVLMIISSIYYSFFLFSEISLQMGWWQYYAYCLTTGDLLYKDVYVYLPPYFPLFTAFLYQFFENNFIYYAVFGFVFVRCLSWVFLYLILNRFFRPLVAFISTFIGICVTSSYLMDQPYDYNPAIFTLVIILTYSFLKLKETNSSKYIILNGLITGCLIMTKQTFGVVMPIISFFILYVYYRKELFYKKISIFILSIIIAVIPGILYLFYTNTFYEMLECLFTATGAKLTNTNLFWIFTRFFIRIKVLLLVCILFVLLKTNLHNGSALKILYGICGILFGFISANFIVPALKYIPELEWFNIFVLISIILISIYLCLKNVITLNIVIFYSVFICLCMFIVSYTSDETASYIWKNTNWRILIHDILYASLYMNIIIFLNHIFAYIDNKERDSKYFVVFAIFGSTLFVSAFSAAELEPYVGLFLVPFAVSFMLQYYFETKKDCKVLFILQNTVIVSCGTVLVLLCLITKMYMPFEWHGWRSESVLKSNTLKLINDIPGMNGYIVSSEDYNSYKVMYELIKNNSDDKSVLYQFPNVTLFNVLLEKKSYYVPIEYFDVCSDKMAEYSFKELEKNIPDLFLWADFSNERWNVHEKIFRGGSLSGQRKIKRFYKETILSEYRCLGVIDNNEGEHIELWQKRYD